MAIITLGLVVGTLTLPLAYLVFIAKLLCASDFSVIKNNHRQISRKRKLYNVPRKMEMS